MHKDQGSGKRKEFATLRKSIMIEEETFAEKDHFDDTKMMERENLDVKKVSVFTVTQYDRQTNFNHFQ